MNVVEATALATKYLKNGWQVFWNNGVFGIVCLKFWGFQNLQLGPISHDRQPRLNYSKWPPLAEWTNCRQPRKSMLCYIFFFIINVWTPVILVWKQQRISFGWKMFRTYLDGFPSTTSLPCRRSFGSSHNLSSPTKIFQKLMYDFKTL